MVHDIKLADDLVGACIERGEIPGAVLRVGHGNTVDFHRAYGYAQVVPDRRPMTEDTLFDLASVTKVAACWPSIVLLLESGTITPDSSLRDMLADRDLPEAAGRITLHQLLTHTAGFVPFHDTEGATRADRVSSLLALPLQSAPGTQSVYSDLSFICLGEIVARYAGAPLDEAAHRVFASLGMRDTCFRPRRDLPFASTEVVGGVTTCGTVHDERAQQLDGVAGHAGLFSTAADLGLFCAALASVPRHPLFLSPWVDRSFERQTPLDRLRGLAWVIYSDAPKGRVAGHSGFTGTSVTLSPDTGAWSVLLTNRVHPSRENQAFAELRKKVASALFGQEA